MKKIISAILIVLLISSIASINLISASAASPINIIVEAYALDANSNVTNQITNLGQMPEGSSIRVFVKITNYKSTDDTPAIGAVNLTVNYSNYLTPKTASGALQGCNFQDYAPQPTSTCTINTTAKTANFLMKYKSSSASFPKASVSYPSSIVGYLDFTVGNLASAQKLEIPFTAGQVRNIPATFGYTNVAYTSTGLTVEPAKTLGANVSYIGKDKLGTKYHVALTDTTSGASYKVYAKDAIFGWFMAKSFGTDVSFDIVVANPTASLELEVLTTDVPSTGNPTFTKTKSEMGQIDITDASLDQPSYVAGIKATLNATVSIPNGVTAKYDYIFGDSLNAAKGITVSGSTISVESYTVNPGTYKVSLLVYDAANNQKFASKEITYVVVASAESVNLPVFKTDSRLGAIADGTQITVTKPDANNSASANYKYRYVSPTGGDKFTSTSNIFSSVRPGIYNIYSDIIAGGKVTDTAYSSIKVANPAGNVTISSIGSVETNYVIGNTVNFIVSAENAEQYMFVRRDATGYRTVKEWSADKTLTWSPARNGVYVFYVYAKGVNAGSYEALKTVTITVGDLSAVAPTFSLNKTIAGEASTITVTNTASNPGCEYAFEIYDTFSNTYVFSGYSASSTYTFVAPKARTYNIAVLVKDSANSGAYDAKSDDDIKFN